MGASWVVFALLAAGSAALVAIFGKIGLEKIDSTTATAVRAVIMAIFLLVVIGVQGKYGNVGEIFGNNKAITFIILSGVAGALSWIFYFLALKLGPVAGVVSIDRLSVVFAVILATLFLGESMNFKTGVGIVFIAIGAILVALK
jgi:transporter family protein